MNPMQKVMLFSGLIMAPLIVALALWIVPAVIEARQDALTLAGFEKIKAAQPPLTVAQVETLLGHPARIEQSESADQTIDGSVYYYPAHGQDMKVVFIRGVVFRTEFAPTAKS